MDTFTEFPLDYGGPFKDIGLTKDKSHLWICNDLGSPLLLDLKTGKEFRPSYTSEIKRPNRIIRDSLGNYWFSTQEKGVFKLDSNQKIIQFSFKQEDDSRRLPRVFVYDLAISAENILWLATNKGVYKIDVKESKVIPFQKRHPYLDLFTTAIIIDDHNKVWLNSKKGIIRLDPNSNQVNYFGPSDGLKNRIYTPRSVYKDEEGKVYFGGDKGIDIIDPDVIGYNKIKPEIYLSNLWVNDQLFELPGKIDQEHNIELHHNENFLTLELLGLHLTAPSKNKYAYNIPEINEQWRDLGSQRKINLANIAPGTYTVIARASNGDGVWSDPKKLITLAIHPAWWNTNWFIAGSILGLGILIFGAYQYKVSTVKERERLKTQYNKQIAEVESKALRAQMNPHFLFNSINAVNSLISQGKNESASEYLKKFGKLIRIVLSNSEKAMVRLEEELEALRLYLEIEQLRFQNFEYEIAVDPLLDVDFIEVPPLLLQPYVENAIWHGLLHRAEGSRKVLVQVFAEGEDLVMTVEDNGIGRERANQLKTKGAARKKGMGMRLTQNRLELLKHLNNSKVSIEINDLFDDQNHPKGTLITIRISDFG